MAGKARRITVEFLGNAKDLEQATDKAARSTGALGGKLKKVGLIAGGALAVGTVVAGKALFDMAKNAAADEAAQRKLAIGIKNATGATDAQVAGVEKWISKQGRVLGVTDDELRPAFQRLVQATGDVDEAQRQMSIAMDVSAGTGKSLKTVSEALMKANNGTTASLSKLGLKTKDAQGNALSLDEALATMSETFKGQASAQANTLEGKMDRLKLVFDETKETIGAKLLPMLTRMATWFLSEGLPALEQFGGWIRENLFPIFRRVAAIVREMMGKVRGDVDGNLSTVKETISNFVSLVRSLWSMFGKDIVRYARNSFNNVRQIIKGVLNVIGGIIKVFSAVLKGDWRKAWEGVKQIMRGAGQVLGGIVKQIFNLIGTLARAGGKALVAIVKGIPGLLRDLGGKFLDAGGFLMGKFVDGLKKVGSVIADIAGDIWSGIKNAFNAVVDAINGKIPDKIGKGKLSIDLPNDPFPKFRAGTTSAPGGWSWVGEAGPELVNLRAGAQVVPSHRLGGGGGAPIIVQLKVGAKVLEQILIEHTRSTGRPLQVRTLGPA